MDNRLPGLDLLRAIAIVWVMLFHSFIVGGLGDDWQWLSRFGWCGVDIFFVLSGFLIGAQVLRPLQRGEPLALGAFYARRAWRILPAFALVLSVYVFLPSLREAPGLQPGWQFASFTMNLLIDYAGHPAFSHAWSLCVEEHFYLLFPLAAIALARRPSARRLWAVCVAIVLGGIALRTAVWLHDVALDPPRNWFIEDLYDPTWMRLDGLLAGVLLAVLRIYAPARWARLRRHADLALLAGLALGAVALWLFRDRTGLVANAVGWPLLSAAGALLVFAAAGRDSLIGRRAVPGAATLATISYSLYLSHKLAMHAVAQALPASWPAVQASVPLRFATYVLAILLAGAVLHALVERPFLRWRDRRAQRVPSLRPPGLAA